MPGGDFWLLLCREEDLKSGPLHKLKMWARYGWLFKCQSILLNSIELEGKGQS